ncbi:peptide ABC transporter substrate-binding protein [Streptomyces endophyticus]|uniref:ABC transporter substrate-binding protein n=1 Tax=Streptomyces endophyticus TaxID=714166 RepID=A0ABU6FDE5_9ACTN|nr:ABC transporter substrate-binding protein [Streptomyces endophyticus]MEB8340861.1 ABC transporter substrate-binding protein [Streptomyces endophyticus]
MRRSRHAAHAVTALAVVLAASACSSGSGSDDGASGGKKSVVVASKNEIPAINPAKDNSSTSIQLAWAMWAPLTDLDQKTGKLKYVVADSVTSKDARTWTIKLKPGWTFTNGEKLTAKAFVDTWNYTAYAPHGYKNNGFFSRIKGYDNLNPASGKPKKTTMSGLKVINDLTFRVTLDKAFSPYPTTLMYYGSVALAPEVLKDPDSYDHKPIGYGPYKLKSPWKAGQPVVMVRNKKYPLKGPEADQLTYRFFSNPETAYNEFLAGNVDYTIVPDTKGDTYKKDAPGKGAVSKAAVNMTYLVPPVNSAPYKDPKVRRALSLALDRKALTKLRAGSFPATSFTAPSLPGYREHTCGACTLDIAKAKQLLKQAGGFPGTLKMYYNSDDPGQRVFAEALGNMWRQSLGIKVAYVGKPAIDLSALFSKGKVDGMYLGGWGHDYPSIEDWLTPIVGSHGDVNGARYSNPALDKLIDEGNALADPAAAIKKYQAAEDLEAEQMPMIPLYHKPDAYLHAPGVEPLDSPYAGLNPVWSTVSR